jgi:DNA-binding IclR family transcriptional regulator
MGLLRQSRPVLEWLVRQCNETSYIAILKDFDIIYLDAVETDLTVRVVTRVGSRLPAYCSAAGKAQLAYLSEEELESYFAGKEIRRFTQNTVIDVNELKRELKKVTELGYSIDNEELDTV